MKISIFWNMILYNAGRYTLLFCDISMISAPVFTLMMQAAGFSETLCLSQKPVTLVVVFMLRNWDDGCSHEECS